MKVAIVGYAVEGQAAYDYWQALGDQVTICDRDPNKVVPEGARTQLGKDYLRDLDRFDLIVRSPGIHPDIITRDNPGIESKITTIIDEFIRVCPVKHIIGVTGTKGKGTTSTLIARMLETAGKRVFLGGNIGVPPLDFLKEIDNQSWVVLELSSFQLHDIKHSPSIAVCLTMSVEHIDWHGSAEAYFEAKARLFAHQEPKDLAIYYAKNEISKEIAEHSPGRKLPYYAPPGAYIKNGTVMIRDQDICKIEELHLLGDHNWQNVCAATTVVWEILKDINPIRTVLLGFTGLEHRLEFVREVGHVKYYNDSYASGTESSAAAIKAVPGNKVMIFGGFDRGIALDPLVQAVVSNTDSIRKLVIIGASGPRLADDLQKAGYTNFVLEPSKQMADVVATARTQAQDGDSVVLSPGFASFDMFKNFTDRGLQFKSVVEQL